MVRPTLTLASASPRRLELLTQIGITPDRVAPAEIDETSQPKELPRSLALRLACTKAQTVRAKGLDPNSVILAADTVVAIGRRVMDKPKDADQARDHLQKLSGRRHRIYGGIAVSTSDERLLSKVVMTLVRFKRLSDDEIEAYVMGGEWQGKAGAYAIQGMAAQFVPWINGSYSNVVGLSLSDVASMLTGAGYRR